MGTPSTRHRQPACAQQLPLPPQWERLGEGTSKRGARLPGSSALTRLALPRFAGLSHCDGRGKYGLTRLVTRGSDVTGIRLGIDIGGPFTDVILLDDATGD